MKTTNSGFVPLTPATLVTSSAAPGSRQPVTPSASSSKSPNETFTPLGQLLARQQVASSCASTASKPGGTPTISLKRDGDRVTHICVSCGCGQVIELACVY